MRGEEGEEERDGVNTMYLTIIEGKRNCNAIPNSDVVSYNVMTVSQPLVQSCIIITLHTMHSTIGNGRHTST